MPKKRPLDKCSNCGGKGGFFTQIKYKATRMYSWDGEDVDTDNYSVIQENKPVCIDCGAPANAAFKRLRTSQ
jgi:hypothetical protein